MDLHDELLAADACPKLLMPYVISTLAFLLAELLEESLFQEVDCLEFVPLWSQMFGRVHKSASQRRHHQFDGRPLVLGRVVMH